MQKVQSNAELVKHLMNLGTGKIKPFKPDYGLCHELDNICPYPARNMITAAWDEWPEFSGQYQFPVKKRGYTLASSAYEDARYKPREMWGKTAYAKRRKRLCVWLAVHFEINPIPSRFFKEPV